MGPELKHRLGLVLSIWVSSAREAQIKSPPEEARQRKPWTGCWGQEEEKRQFQELSSVQEGQVHGCKAG
jgi:hypothetical protein